MPRRVVLDACVLYPQSVRDTLLYVAQRRLFAPVWSVEIIEEVRRNLVPARLTPEAFTRFSERMNDVWPEAMATRHVTLTTEDAPGVSEKDLHVLGTAIAEHADLIVTVNVRDFSSGTCAQRGIEVYHPDRFLCELHDENPWQVLSALAWQSLGLLHD